MNQIEEPVRHRKYFISHGRPLYSLMHRGGPAAPVIIYCHGFAQEHLFNWRAEVLGADILARRGYSTFSYHARAHGDSAGNFADLTFEGLVEDAMAAADHATAATGATRIVWVGIRFGALVAAAVIRQRSDALALALWEPVHNTPDYFRALMRRVMFFEVSRGRRPSMTVDEMIEELRRDRAVPMLGFDLHPQFYRSALAADLRDSLDDWSGPTMLVQIQQRGSLSPEHQALQTVLELRSVPVKTVLMDEEPNWDNGFESWWTLEGLSREMGAWLDGLE